jgi:hypothetical protein
MALDVILLHAHLEVPLECRPLEILSLQRCQRDVIDASESSSQTRVGMASFVWVRSWVKTGLSSYLQTAAADGQGPNHP